MHTNYTKNVFVNCPFDLKYKPLLKTLVFTISYFEFIPRLALEISDSGKMRLEKILEIINESQYGIHDLSRIQAKKIDEFFRFNMPFELGVDFGCKRFNIDHSKKAFLILAKEEYDYMKSISDLKGIDIKNHNDDPEEIINKVREWFIETVNLRKLDGAMKIWFKYNDFQKEIFENRFSQYYKDYDEHTSERMAKQDIESMPFPEFIDEIKDFLLENSTQHL